MSRHFLCTSQLTKIYSSVKQLLDSSVRKVMKNNQFFQRRLGFFLDELFAVGRLVGGDDFFREFVGHVVVV